MERKIRSSSAKITQEESKRFDSDSGLKETNFVRMGMFGEENSPILKNEVKRERGQPKK